MAAPTGLYQRRLQMLKLIHPSFEESVREGYDDTPENYQGLVSYLTSVSAYEARDVERFEHNLENSRSTLEYTDRSVELKIPPEPADVSSRPIVPEDHTMDEPESRTDAEEAEVVWLKHLRQRIKTTLSPTVKGEQEVPQIRTPVYDSLLKKDSETEAEIARLRKSLENSKIDQLPTLSKEALAVVQSALAASGPAIIVTGFSVELKRADIRTLRNGQWLNDEIINFYGELIMERAKNTPKLPQLHYFNTFFLPTLRDQGYSMVRRWTRKFDLFAKELVIIPVHLGMHWCCSIINFKKKRIEYYDSLHGSYNIIFKVLRDYLASESMDKKKKPFDFEGWTDYAPKSIPAQRNGYDCGVFTCMFAEFSSRQAPFTFTQIDMPDLRNRIASEIINKKLMV